MTIAFTKYDGTPHWRYSAQLLHVEPRGRWFFIPVDTAESRPGRRWRTLADGLIFIPSGGLWCARIQDAVPEAPYRIYVDLARPVGMSEAEIRLIDMDLDVIQDHRGIWVDDEDEFAAHSQVMAYPASVVRETETTCAEVVQRVSRRQFPFDLDFAHRLRELRRQRLE